MFWRILRRLLSANRGRLFVMLLALGAGAAVTAALLNLQVDAKRRLTAEFRAFGPNVLIVPSASEASSDGERLLNQSVLGSISSEFQGQPVTTLPFLYSIAEMTAKDAGLESPVAVVVVGTDLTKLPLIYSTWDFGPYTILGLADPSATATDDVEAHCILGNRLAMRFQLTPLEEIKLENGAERVSCKVVNLLKSGSAEDDQVFVDLPTAQHLKSLSSRINLIQVSVGGPPTIIQQFLVTYSQKFPKAEVRPIRQFTEGEAKIYNRISGLLTATVGIVLLLTALCVMAAMTNVAMERKMDVGLMKAIGGATRRVVRLFLAEAALLGLFGGLIGAAAGILLSIGLGKAVFGVAARPRLIVYPVAVGLTVLVAILSAFPLRRLASLRPASVFRGEA